MQVGNVPFALSFHRGDIPGDSLVKAVPVNQSFGVRGDQQEADDSLRYVAHHGHRRKGQKEEARLAWGRHSCQALPRGHVPEEEDLREISALYRPSGGD